MNKFLGKSFFLRVKTLSSTNLATSRNIKREKASLPVDLPRNIKSEKASLPVDVSRYIKREKPHFRLTCVAQKRRCLNTLLCPNYRPFPHYAPVRKHKEMRTRLGWTISYKSPYFVHLCLCLQECKKGLLEIEY